MRFLHITTGQFIDGDPRRPEYGYYAILSHIWDRNGEQSFQQLKKIQERYVTGRSVDDPRCMPSRSHEWLIDSCCIDKSSSAELSEAINSMYAWYAGTRAPNSVRAYGSNDWSVISSKRHLVDLIEGITGITSGVLLHEASLDKFSVAERLSRASTRVTTRVEDEAYCLLRIFDINMPPLYGEGERAFRRLPEQIMQHVPDQSLFVGWSRVYMEPEVDRASNRPFFCMRNPSIASFFAQAPSSFELASTVHAVPHHDVYRRLHLSQTPASEYTSTPHGIRMQLPLLPLSRMRSRSPCRTCRTLLLGLG
uniref:DUF8212 domain-containing protein n=1 Tax=Ganoderma boninense TaxID=34458 RepID=A0A5K1K6M8_9APHY|nr:Uncharacterized protein [Ganoderma boninense]